MTIAIDFDGTCVEHNYPDIGKDIGAVPVLQELVANKHDLILWTMRSGKELLDAIKWFEINGIKLRAANVNPSQTSWTDSPKCYAQLYIDDAALGCPLVEDKFPNGKFVRRSYVDWVKVREILVQKGVIK